LQLAQFASPWIQFVDGHGGSIIMMRSKSQYKSVRANTTYNIAWEKW
jgi:hypothetical protein